MRQGRSTRVKGFTLVELLVVISIIALLMSILMPALSRAKEQAKGVICKSRLKDIGLVFLLYGGDYEGAIPPTFAMNLAEQKRENDDKVNMHWFSRIGPYYDRGNNPTIKGTNSLYDYTLYRCPTQDYITRMVKKAGNNSVVVKSRKTGLPIRLPDNAAAGIYGLNAYFSGYGALGGDNTYNYRKLDKAKRSSELPLLGDMCAESREFSSSTPAGWLMSVDFPHPDAYKYGWPENLFPVNYQLYGAAPNHRGNINFLFADMHCESKGLWPWHDKKDSKTSRSRYFHPEGKKR